MTCEDVPHTHCRAMRQRVCLKIYDFSDCLHSLILRDDHLIPAADHVFEAKVRHIVLAKLIGVVEAGLQTKAKALSPTRLP
jgi:hypothetical protein